MSQDVLSHVRQRLNNLKASADRMVESAPQLLENEYIKEQWEILCQAHTEAIARLENPVLSIATIGTTSSGKSTLTNALIGRRIAPIEAGEMSGGVLTITHADERTLEIEATPGSTWETGRWTNISDEEIYNRCSVVMHEYHEQRKHKKDIMAPQIKTSGPLLPVCNSELLGLPPGVGVEFIDLPGLKSIQDKANLAVIQPRVQKAFSLVALDYLQVDDEHRRRLLEELKQVVEYLRGRTDSMIFVLNRVDNIATNDDIPLEKKLEKLKAEIRETLNLSEEPAIIPFTARLLYNAQCAWGTTELTSDSSTDQGSRLRYLDAIFSDCGKVLKKASKANPATKAWLRDLEDKVQDEEFIEDQSLKRVLQIANYWSGGKSLWDCLHGRVQESFTNIVILPAVISVTEAYKSLGAAVSSFLQIKQEVDIEQIRATRDQLSLSFDKAKEAISFIDQKYEEKLNKLKNLLAENNDDNSKLLTYVEQEGIEGIKPLRNATEDVERDINKKLIIPVKDALDKDSGVYDLEEKLLSSSSPLVARHVASAYDLTRGKLVSFKLEKDFYYKKVRTDSTSEVHKLDQAEKAIRSLYQRMKEGIAIRAEFSLQGKAEEFEKAITSFLSNLIDEINETYRTEFNYLGVNEILEAKLFNSSKPRNIEIPEEIFVFKDDVKSAKKSNYEKVGTENHTERYKEGSCFSAEKTRTKTRDKMDYVDYTELYLPNSRKMSEQWLQGIRNSQPELWQRISEWMVEYLKVTIANSQENMIDVVNFAKSSLDKQLTDLENLEVEVLFWASVGTQFERVLRERDILLNDFFSN